MTKKHFIALANTIREFNTNPSRDDMFSQENIEALADFCKLQNSNFNRERWLSYIAGECGLNGGSR